MIKIKYILATPRNSVQETLNAGTCSAEISGTLMKFTYPPDVNVSYVL